MAVALSVPESVQSRKARLMEIHEQAAAVVVEIEASIARRGGLPRSAVRSDWACARFCGPFIEGFRGVLPADLVLSADPETAPPTETTLWAHLRLLDSEAHQYGGCAVSDIKLQHTQRVGHGRRVRLQAIRYRQVHLFE